MLQASIGAEQALPDETSSVNTLYSNVSVNHPYVVFTALADSQHVASLWWVIVSPGRVLVEEDVELSITHTYHVLCFQEAQQGILSLSGFYGCVRCPSVATMRQLRETPAE